MGARHILPVLVGWFPQGVLIYVVAVERRWERRAAGAPEGDKKTAADGRRFCGNRISGEAAYCTGLPHSSVLAPVFSKQLIISIEATWLMTEGLVTPSKRQLISLMLPIGVRS